MLTDADNAFMARMLALIAPDVERPITYRVYAGAAGGNPVLSIPATVTYINQATTAIVHEFTAEEVQAAGGVFQIGDFTFGVRRDAVDARDQIVYQGVTWQVTEIYSAALGGATLTWWLRCKRA
jgi:hypothetical protein